MKDDDLLGGPESLDELPVGNLPILSVTHGPYTVEGWSRAAVQTYYRIPELKLTFDIGGSPWAFMGTPNVAVSHAHLDHLAALPQFVARRRMMKMDPPTILLPEPAREPTERMLRSWHKLDRGRMACEIIGMEPADDYTEQPSTEHWLNKETLLTCFETKHTVPSVGYVVWEVRRKLKEEYQHLTGPEIRDLRLSGTEVAQEVRVPLVCYCGDTAAEGLDNEPAVYEAKILITEMSFFRPEHSPKKIRKFGHTHLNDIVDRADRFNNECIILGHLSTRTSPRAAKKALDKRLPKDLRERVHLWAD